MKFVIILLMTLSAFADEPGKYNLDVSRRTAPALLLKDARVLSDIVSCDVYADNAGLVGSIPCSYDAKTKSFKFTGKQEWGDCCLNGAGSQVDLATALAQATAHLSIARPRPTSIEPACNNPLDTDSVCAPLGGYREIAVNVDGGCNIATKTTVPGHDSVVTSMNVPCLVSSYYAWQLYQSNVFNPHGDPKSKAYQTYKTYKTFRDWQLFWRTLNIIPENPKLVSGHSMALLVSTLDSRFMNYTELLQ